MLVRSLAALLILLLAWPEPGLAAGVIRGRILLAHMAKAAASDESAKPEVQKGVTDAVIYLERIPEKVERKLAKGSWFSGRPKPPTIVHRDLHYVPRVLTIPAGTEVQIRNLDRVFHNTFCVSAARPFDLGKYPPGHEARVDFPRAGIANLHCDIHPDEIGYVVITPNHAAARPDSFGRYRLPKIPDGRYVVQVWHPRRGQLRREIEMPRRGNLTLDLGF